jgi:Domain of unknown function (DUF4112)
MSRYPLAAQHEPTAQAPDPGPPLEGEVLLAGSSPESQGPVALLDLVSFVMDRLVQVPGTRLRIGLNSLALLLPVFGDVITSLVSVGILVIGLTSYRVPRIVAFRMVLNTLLDTSLGWIPVVGDLFDMFFKADTRNVRLLQEYLGHGTRPPRPTWRHWAFVLGLLAAFAAVLALIVIGLVALVHLITQSLAAH